MVGEAARRAREDDLVAELLEGEGLEDRPARQRVEEPSKGGRGLLSAGKWRTG